MPTVGGRGCSVYGALPLASSVGCLWGLTLAPSVGGWGYGVYVVWSPGRGSGLYGVYGAPESDHLHLQWVVGAMVPVVSMVPCRLPRMDLWTCGKSGDDRW